MIFNVKVESIYILINKNYLWNVNWNSLKKVCQTLLCSMNANVTYYHSNFWDDEHHHYYFSFLLSKFNKSVAHHKSLNINNRWIEKGTVYVKSSPHLSLSFILPAITHFFLQGLTSRCWHMLLKEIKRSSSDRCYQIPLIPSLAEYCAK